MNFDSRWGDGSGSRAGAEEAGLQPRTEPRPSGLLREALREELGPNSFARRLSEGRVEWQNAISEGRWSDARNMLNLELRRLEERYGRDSRELIQTLRNLGLCHMNTEPPNYEQARAILERCLRLYDPHHPSAHQCDVRTNLAFCHLHLPRETQPETPHATQEERERATRQERQRLDRAIRLVTEGITNIGELAQTPSHAELLGALADLEMRRATLEWEDTQARTFRSAARHYAEAIAIMDRNGDSEGLIPLLEGRADALLHSDTSSATTEQWRAALPSLERIATLMDIDQENWDARDPAARPQSYFHLGLAHMHIANDEQGAASLTHRREAISAFGRTLALYEQIPVEAWEALSEAVQQRLRDVARDSERHYMDCCIELRSAAQDAQGQERDRLYDEAARAFLVEIGRLERERRTLLDEIRRLEPRRTALLAEITRLERQRPPNAERLEEARQELEQARQQLEQDTQQREHDRRQLRRALREYSRCLRHFPDRRQEVEERTRQLNGLRPTHRGD
jgi:hypothetical protein